MMQHNTEEILKQKMSNLSMLFIVVNIILLLIYANKQGCKGDQQTLNYCYLASGAILLGCYALSYHGKGYRIASGKGFANNKALVIPRSRRLL
ncbi:MAG: hypothetical protein EOP00_11190 [Pedobacter sp.]|nr:MAG: hypothetical protein EOP00_11190 [Pedobacter sp.]